MSELLETPVRASRAARPPATTLSVCCMTAGPPGRVAAILSLLRPVADELLVAVDDRADPDLLARLSASADRLILYPYAEPVDRPLAWLHAEATGDWVLSVDDDEIPSLALVAALPALLADEEATHHWLPRRWVFPSPETYLDEAPWRPDYQLRLVRNDRRFLRFSDEFHRPIVALGPGRFSEHPLWHVDPLVRPEALRRRKARRYERLRPGMRIAGRALNHAFYVPELRHEPRRAPLPPEERELIERVLSAAPPSRHPPVLVEHATREGIDLYWPGRQLASYRAALDLLEPPPALTVDEQRTVDVRVHNLGEERWDWGREAEPEIRLAVRWRAHSGAETDAPELRTHLPAAIEAEASDVVPVHVVAPSRPGRYRLRLDLVHEHVRWFGCEVGCDVEVRAARRIGLVGDDGAIEAVAELLGMLPELEPLVVPGGGEPASRFGYERLPGLRPYLLGGLSEGTSPRLAAVLAARTAALLRAARRPKELPRGGARFLEALGRCEALVVAGWDAPPHAAATRELWRVAATVLAARALGVRVALGAAVFAGLERPEDRALAALVRRRAEVIFAEPLELAAWLERT